LFFSSYATCLFNNVVVLSNLLCFLAVNSPYRKLP
jgi:hypothetical protein